MCDWLCVLLKDISSLQLYKYIFVVIQVFVQYFSSLYNFGICILWILLIFLDLLAVGCFIKKITEITILDDWASMTTPGPDPTYTIGISNRVSIFKSTCLTKGSLPKKKLQNLWHPANFNCHLPTLPNYDINFYDKAVIIEAPTHLQVIMTNIKINFISSCFIFIIFNGKMDKQAL